MQNFSHFSLDKLCGVWYNKNSACEDRARRKENKKRVEISPHYFDELELLKKPPMKLNKSTTPKACQKVNANAILNKLSTQFASNMKIHPSKQRIPNTNAITIITANNVLIPYISLSFDTIIIPLFILFVKGDFLFPLIFHFYHRHCDCTYHSTL